MLRGEADRSGGVMGCGTSGNRDCTASDIYDKMSWIDLEVSVVPLAVSASAEVGMFLCVSTFLFFFFFELKKALP